jgi:hypothetical protein
MKHWKVLLVFVIALFSLISCAVSNKKREILSVKHGFNFGMCNGYCFKENTYTSEDFIHYEKAYGRTNPKDFPEKMDSISISPKEWEQIISKIDLEKFYAEQETIGCPDCADGGSEWIEIATTDKVYRVTFEFGKPSEELKAIYSVLRKL